jgi:hypothetical protein
MWLFIYQERTQYVLNQIFRRRTDGRGSISHPNLLPIIEISETPFPFCVMSPWMPGGNIIQYTKANPGADRLTLVCVHRLEDKKKMTR